MPDTDNTKGSPPRKTLLVIKLAAWGAGGLIFLALLAIIALHMPPVQKKVIHWAVSRIESATKFKVQIQSYRWRPFSGISLDQVKIESEGKQILDCEKVRLKYRLSTKRPYVTIKEVYLKKPFLQLERNNDGKWVVPAPIGGKGEGNERLGAEPSWTQIQFPKIQIFSGTIEARQQGNTILHVKDISGAVYLKAIPGAEGPQIRLNFENLHARARLGEWVTCGTGGLETLAR